MAKNVLFVNACVREGSRTLSLCRNYLRTCCPDAAVQELVLAQEQLRPLDREGLEKRNADIIRGDLSGARYGHARNFAAADRIVIGAPYWDCSFPALLKIYLEQICVNGITFGYSKEGAPLPLCKADRLVYITTSGGPIGEALRLHLEDLCRMFGIAKLELYAAEGLDIFGNDPEAILRATAEKMS